MTDDRQKARRDGRDRAAIRPNISPSSPRMGSWNLRESRWLTWPPSAGPKKCIDGDGRGEPVSRTHGFVCHLHDDPTTGPRSTRLTDVAFVLNIDDNHIVAYSLRKLEKLGLLGSVKRGKEKFYETTPAGADLVHRYRACRVDLLLSSGKLRPGNIEEVLEAARVLRELSGNYDQAARRAATAL